MRRVILISFYFVVTASLDLWRCKPADLTHRITSHMPVWPSSAIRSNRYKVEALINGTVPASVNNNSTIYYYATTLSFADHIGTHIDAPRHILEGLDVMRDLTEFSKLPLNAFIGEACVFDVSDKHKDYLISVEDVKEWEKEHGRLHERCFIIVRTGYSKHWNNVLKYAGVESEERLLHTNDVNINDQLHWPSLHPETAQWILDNRGMLGVGIDTLSTDAGHRPDGNFKHSVHTIVQGANKIGIENMANLEVLPIRGATILALPPPLRDASGAPARVIAYGHKDDQCRTPPIVNGASITTQSLLTSTILMIFTFLLTQ